ncbi:hypothetical protein BG015_007047 [Linnemannia schmuckeri]|uniref:BTB domain-containing protein n=1 Tax=Linnemannia schmuckeri TaxID=64567 RepID=A0A9P5S9Z5_9FUNG|nr:hypothetical protein BG015_007047 [Linnemannia schmuckeri]
MPMSPSSLTLDGELLKVPSRSKGKKPSNSLDGSRASPAPLSPILSDIPPAVPPKTSGSLLMFSPVVRENGCQQPVTLPRELSESPRLSRVPSGVVMVADIVLNPVIPTPSSAATSIHSAPAMQSSVPILTALDDANQPPPVPARRNETKPMLSYSVSVPSAVRIPVPSTTPENLIQGEKVSSSTGSLEGSPVMVCAQTVPFSNGISSNPIEAARYHTTPITAPSKPLVRPSANQQPTPSITTGSTTSPTSDSPAASPTAATDISNDFFASKKHNSPSPQQEQQSPQQQQQCHHSQQAQQRVEEPSQSSCPESRAYLPPSSPLPSPSPPPAASPPMRVPAKRMVLKPPSAFMTDAASLLRRLFNDPLYSDMDLSVDDTTFHTHRGVLAEHCSYFREFFTNARAQEPTTEFRHLDCSYSLITFERSRPFSIAQANSDDDSILGAAARRLHARRDCPAQEEDAGSVLGSEDDEDGLCFADVENNSSIDRHHNPTGPFRATSQQKHQHSTDPTRLRAGPPSSHSKLNPKANLRPSTPNSASPSTSTAPDDEPITSFAAAFVAADKRSLGYTSHHFACFLQIIYGLLHPLHLHEDDLLAVFRIAYIYGFPGLVNILSNRICDTLDLTTETWPCLVRFSERFCLEDIKRRVLRHASETREMWAIAVETLGLDDFKVFLRGIDQSEGGKVLTKGQGQGADLRGLKDELLMMFLLVHYQESSYPKELGPSLHHDEESSMHTGAALMRRMSTTYQRDSARVRIRQQLQQRPSMPNSPNLPTRINNNTKSKTNSKTTSGTFQQPPSTNSLAIGPVTLSSSPPSSPRQMPAQAQTTKVDKAKMWMTRFKHDCGWGGQVPLLD